VPPSGFGGDAAGLSAFSDFSDFFSDLSDLSDFSDGVAFDDFSALSAFFRDSEG